MIKNAQTAGCTSSTHQPLPKISQADRARWVELMAAPRQKLLEDQEEKASCSNEKSFNPDFSTYVIKESVPTLPFVSALIRSIQKPPQTMVEPLPIQMPFPGEIVVGRGGANPRRPALVDIQLLWKALIRAFRRFIRYESIGSQIMAHIKTLSLEQQGRTLAVALDLPAEISMQPKYQSALLLLFFSHRYIRRNSLIPPARVLMESHLEEIWHKFYLVFSSNKMSDRYRFFCDPLVSFLWARFREAKPQEILQTFSSAQNSYFKNEILQMESCSKCGILPQVCQ